MTKQSFEGRTSSRHSEHGTPDYIFNPLNEEFHYIHDLAATDRNTKVPDSYWTTSDDALSRDWPLGGWLWLNPPYSRRVKAWIEKALKEAQRGAKSTILINANTESQWFQHIAVPYAREIRLFEYRISFIDWETVAEMEAAGASSEDVLKFIEDGNGSYHPSCLLVFDSDFSKVPNRMTFTNENRFSYVSF